MGMLCAVTLVDKGQLHYADPGALSPEVGDKVLLPTEHGPVVGTVVWAAEYVSDDTDGFPTVLGPATQADVDAQAELRQVKARTMVATRRLVREHGLPMKILAADPQADAGRTVIYYTSPETVDFRSLLRDLSATLHTRVELRQLAARDAVRATGAIGSCGRDTCCSTFLKDYEPVTLAMARDQDLPVNPLRISGACGRLMCCLKYEHPLYQEFKATAPAVGQRVDSPAGPGTVVSHSVPTDSVVIRLNGDGSHQVCPRASVCGARKAYESRRPAGPSASATSESTV
ncbi:MAG TPA: regulatory iron-sulfur-containing complex subunit RicT [Nakamurella sp.]|nr:regulatory iron-sulfur-containing complex subunit RicT [Nakamurella sp.]